MRRVTTVLSLLRCLPQVESDLKWQPVLIRELFRQGRELRSDHRFLDGLIEQLNTGTLDDLKLLCTACLLYTSDAADE